LPSRWLDPVVPSFAFEVASQDWEKDDFEVPARYDELGVRELVIFDPWSTERTEGIRWQVFRRVGRRGLMRVEASRGDRVRSKALGCWLRAVGAGRDTRVRIAVGARGEELVPTAEENERAAREAERTERAAKEAALARVNELEAELRRLRRPRRRRLATARRSNISIGQFAVQPPLRSLDRPGLAWRTKSPHARPVL
jgi:hypothetical protein